MRNFDKAITTELLEKKQNYWIELIKQELPKMTDRFYEITEAAAFSSYPGCWGDIDNNLMHSNAIPVLFESMFSEWFKEYREYTKETNDFILTELYVKLPKKNDDYGVQNLAELGISGLVKVLGNKLHRYKNLVTTDKEPNYESIEQNLFDILAYLMIGLLMCKKWLWEN